MNSRFRKILRGFLIFGGAYFIFDGLLHLSNIKLLSIDNAWPQSAISYGKLLNYLYASFILLAGAIAFCLQANLEKYKSQVIITGIWAVFHGIMLLFLVYTQNYQEIFQSLPSLLVFLPFYKEYLIMNSFLLFGYGGVVYLWLKK